jgi:hypothetical protein
LFAIVNRGQITTAVFVNAATVIDYVVWELKIDVFAFVRGWEFRFKCILDVYIPDWSLRSAEFWDTLLRKVRSVDRVSLFATGRICTRWHRASNCKRRFLIPEMKKKI